MKIKGKITILCDEDGATIELHDEDASLTFARVKLTSTQYCQALGRLAYTPCFSMEVKGLDKVGKQMENRPLIFEVPKELPYKRDERDKLLIPILEKVCPEGWVYDMGFHSQDSFFSKDGKSYAKTTIRRWVKV
jgi:hypothetical protein